MTPDKVRVCARIPYTDLMFDICSGLGVPYVVANLTKDKPINLTAKHTRYH